MARATGAITVERVRVGSRRLLCLGDDRRVEPAARRVEERPVRLLRGMREPAVEAVEQNRRSAFDDGRGFTPQAQRETQPEVGRQ